MSDLEKIKDVVEVNADVALDARWLTLLWVPIGLALSIIMFFNGAKSLGGSLVSPLVFFWLSLAALVSGLYAIVVFRRMDRIARKHRSKEQDI